MVVSYLTIGKPDTATVKYGLVSHQYNYKATGESVNYLKVISVALWVPEKFSEFIRNVNFRLIIERYGRYRHVPQSRQNQSTTTEH